MSPEYTKKIPVIKALFDEHWPGNKLVIESLAERAVRIRQTPSRQSDLRPGNTVSGPFMMSAVDTALYVAVLNEVGLKELAVTTSLTINFLSKPRADADIIADCRLLKVGRKLVVGEVTLFSQGQAQAIAHATGTYALPSN